MDKKSDRLGTAGAIGFALGLAETHQSLHIQIQ